MEDPASRTLALGHGTCANHARLFVALCRAAGIPSRTVRGITYNGESFDTYHEWAEFQDENGVWHSLDPLCEGFPDLEAITSLDLIYAAEENPFLTQEDAGHSIDVTVVYDTDPARGRLGFEIVDQTSKSFTIENTYDFPQSTP